MADFVQQTTVSSGLLPGATVQWTSATATHPQCLATPILAEESKVISGDPTTSDLLQQALSEVSFDAGGGEVPYVEHGGEILYVQEDGKLVSLDGMIASGNMAVMSVPQTAGVAYDNQQGAVTMDVGTVLYATKNTDTVSAFIPSDSDVVNATSSSSLAYSNTVESVYQTDSLAVSELACPVQVNNVRSTSSSHISTEGYDNIDTVPSIVRESDSAPLGTSQNPIRIIQRGNQYTAMQHLKPDQLSQILQVIQQQQQATQVKNPSSDSSAMLYNPDAGSQVVYRITTSMADSSADYVESDNGTVVRMISGADHGHQKRVVRKRKKDEDDLVTGGEWSRQEKEERKKHRPRTRSGRVSKPPQYMVKDYKHIHPVDYDEDYDDSDGGYSDFKHSGDEDGNEHRRLKDDGLTDASQRHWKHYKCDTCEKRYIGTAGLARHYRINPTHDKLPSEQPLSATAMVATPDCSSDGPSMPDISASEPVDMPPADQTATLTADDVALRNDQSHPLPVKKRGRGRPPIYKLSDRRKAQLREMVQRCSSEDLLQVALPRLAGVASLWDFMSARLPHGNNSVSDMSRILQEYNDFRCQVKSVCEKRLTLVKSTDAESELTSSEDRKSTSESPTDDTVLATTTDVEMDCGTHKQYDMSSSDVAESLGLPVGRYKYDITRRQEQALNDSRTEVSLDAGTAADPSHLTTSQVEIGSGSALLQDNSQCGKDETIADNTTEKSTADDADRLQTDTMSDSRLEADVAFDTVDSTSAAAMQTDGVTTDTNNSLVSSVNTDSPVVSVRSNGVPQPNGDGCEGRNENVCSELGPSDACPTKTADEDTCGETNALLISEKLQHGVGMAGDGFCKSVDSDTVCMPDGARLGSETVNVTTSETADVQQSNSSETVTLMPNTENLEGLLKVISRT